MKRRIYVLSLLFFMILPKSINAAVGTISLNCTPASVDPGAEVNCTVTGNADFGVATIEIPFSLGNDLTAIAFNFPQSSNFYGGLSGSKINISTGTDVSGNFTLGTFKIKVGQNAASGTRTISFNNVLYKYLDGSTVNIPDTSASISVNGQAPIKSTLKSLSVSSSVGVLSPQFSSNSYSYNLLLTFDTTSFRLSASPTNSGDTIIVKNGDTNETLDASSINYVTPNGQDSMRLAVTVGSGDTASTYNILVTKEQEPSYETGNPYLASLTLSNQTVNLKNQSNVAEEITVTLNTTSNYQLRATLSDSANFTFSMEALPSSCSNTNGVLTCNLSGETRIAIMVLPKSGSGASKNYILTVKKGSGGGSPSQTISANPQTGSAAYVMAIVLFLSLVGTLYLYKKNINNF